METFSTDGFAPAGGLVACLDRALAGLSHITLEQIPLLVSLVDKWSDVLFKFYPGWFRPLFDSPTCQLALMSLSQSPFCKVMASVIKDAPLLNKLVTRDISEEFVIQFCLRFQSSLRPHPTDDELANSNSLSGLLMKIPLSKLYQSIVHYVHPNQEAELSSLQSQFPIHFTFSPLHQQYTVPPEARPKLFPTIDTSLFSPQFDWLVYLLSKYSPDGQFGRLLRNIIKEAFDYNSPTLLRPDFSIPDTFIHTNAFNSFDEFLSAKLPAVTSQLNLPAIDDTNDIIDTPPLFSYFPNPHPCLPTPESRTPTEYAELTTKKHFRSHFVYSFLLGTSLFSQQRPHFSSIDFVRYASQFDLWACHKLPVSLHMQFGFYLYRTHLLTTDIDHLTAHFAKPSSTSQPPIHTTPPSFSHPYFPLYLSIGPFYWAEYPSIAFQTDPTSTESEEDASTSKLVQRLSIQRPLLFPVLIHILHHIPTETNPIDTYIIDLFEQDNFFDQLTTQAQVDDPDHNLAVFCDCFIVRSYQRYLEGKSTLHQHLYQVLKEEPHTIPKGPNCFYTLLFHPFLRYNTSHTDPILNKHILLTIHAGFITTPSRRAYLYETLVPVRSAFIGYLVNNTHLDSFFPPSERFRHQKLYQLIPHVTDFQELQSTRTQENMMSITIPPSKRPLHNTIATSFPTLRSVIYDDNGRIHAISFRPDDCFEDNDDDLLCEHLYEDSVDYIFELKFETSCGRHPPLAPSKFTPTISTVTQELILSDENVRALKNPQSTLVQNHLIKHFKAAAATDTPRVQSKLQQVLLYRDLQRIHADSISTNSSQSPQTLPYPLPPPIHMPHSPSPEYWAKVADWSLELLIVCVLDLHPPLRIRHTPRSTIIRLPESQLPFEVKNSSTFTSIIETGKETLLQRLRPNIMTILHLKSDLWPNTVQADFYDTMISCTLSPVLHIFDTLASLPLQLIEPPPPAP